MTTVTGSPQDRKAQHPSHVPSESTPTWRLLIYALASSFQTVPLSIFVASEVGPLITEGMRMEHFTREDVWAMFIIAFVGIWLWGWGFLLTRSNGLLYRRWFE